MTFLRRALITILIITPVFCFAQEAAQELDMEDIRRRILGEAPGELMNYSLGDASVSLFLTGSWKGELQGNLGFFSSPVGNGFISPETPLLFKQEVDLSMSLWIDDRWFVEANFVDESSQNTYRAGFQGRPGEFLQYAGIGNTGLDFPSFAYLDLGGDSPSSFGLYSRFGTENLNFHALVRYDAASREERTFTGNRERTYSDVSLSNSIRAVSFVLPDENIVSDIIVFIEDERGTIHVRGRRWRYALASEYAVSASRGLLELGIRPSGMVAVAYSINGDKIQSLNEYLENAQDWFDSTRTRVNLSQYTMCYSGVSASGGPWDLTLDGNPVLVIYQPGTFSPFERRNRYDAPSSSSERASLVRVSTGADAGGFELVMLDASMITDIPVNTEIVSNRNVYELLPSGSTSDKRGFENIWPLAPGYPELYLPPANNFSGDLILRFTNFNSVSGYFIGTDVIPGSVQVFRSGILDTGFSYNQNSGEVTISGAGMNETIRITYLRKSDGMRFGSIAAGLGAVYGKKSSPFSLRTAVGIRWNLTDEAFTQENDQSTGTVGISVQTKWDYDFLKAHAAAGFTFVQTDTTGLYRAAGMEGNELILSLMPDESFISNPFKFNDDEFDISDRADLIFRNYINNNVFTNSLMSIDWNAPLVAGINRPYPARDSRLGDTQILALEFSELETGAWTGFQIPLGFNADIISRAAEIDIPFRFFDFNGNTDNFKVIAQIGSLSGKDFYFPENHELIWEAELFGAAGNFNTDTRVLRFTLNEEDRRRLGDAKYLRFAVVNEGTGEISGRILFAPPVVRGSSFRPAAFNGTTIVAANNDVIVTETREIDINNFESSFPDVARRLHSQKSSQRVLKIEWEENPLSGMPIGADGRIGEVPLSDYRELSFFVKPNIEASDMESGILDFLIGAGPDSYMNAQSTQIFAQIPLSQLTAGQWSKISLRYQGSNTGIFINNNKINGNVNYKALRSSNDDYGRTSYIAVMLRPDGIQFSRGSIFIDEIILEDSVLFYRMNAGSSVSYTKEGAFAYIADTVVLSDLRVSTALETEARTASDAVNDQFSSSVYNRSSMDVSVFGADVSGSVSFAAAKDDFSWSADHSISRYFGPFFAKESFFASPHSNQARHTINLAYKSNLFAAFDADAFYDYSRLRQKWNMGLGYNPQKTIIPSVSINSEALWIRTGNIDENESYAQLWLKTFDSLIPDKGENADTRRTQTQFLLTQRTKPVGAVLTLQGITSFSGLNSLTRSESSAFLDVPVSLSGANINFRMGRSFRKHLFFHGSNIFDDGNKLLESINDSVPLLFTLPFYSLFNPQLSHAMDKSLSLSPSAQYSQYTSFSDHYSVRINLPPIYSLYAFLVPVRMNFRIERTLEEKLDTRTDILNLGSGMTFAAINMFGNLGRYSIFKFYQTDEYSHGIDAAIIIPKDEQISWRAQSTLKSDFKGFTGGSLNLTNTFTVRSGGYWTESFLTGWETPTKKSPLSSIYNMIASSVERQGWSNFSSVLGMNYEQLRRETLEVVFDKSTDYLFWSIIAGHEEIVRILGRLNFTSFIKLRLSENKNSGIFTFDAMAGTTLRVSF